VKDNLSTKVIDYFTTFGEEINFELSLIELIDYKLYIVCIYRAPDGEIDIFLNKLVRLIQKLLSKNKSLLLCGDWNIDLLHANNNKKDLVDLLERYNLINTVQTPTRITNSTRSMIDLMIVNDVICNRPASNHELGLSDHLAQILPVMCRKSKCVTTITWRRNFNKNNILKFTNLLDKMTWHEVISESEVNIKFEKFMNKLGTLFDTAFPLRQTQLRKTTTVTWITQGIRNSSKKIRLFNILKKHITLSKGTELYISKYNLFYKRVIKEAKQRENDRFLSRAVNKSKAVWKVINKELGKPSSIKQDLTLLNQSDEITDSNVIADLFNVHFCDMPLKLLKSRKTNDILPPGCHRGCIQGCKNSIFLTPVTENEVVKVARSLKNKFATGSDDIPDYVIKQSIEYLKKPLTSIHNLHLR
jgi:hypothetical protein